MTIIIKIDNHAIYFNPEYFIPIQKSNLPIKYFKFRVVEEIYWKVELLNYVEELKCWNLRVLEYQVSDPNNFTRQKSNKVIENVCFEKLDWHKWEPQLSSYQEINLIDSIFNFNPRYNSRDLDVNFNHSKFVKPDLSEVQSPKSEIIPSPQKNDIKPSGPKIETLIFNYSVSFEESTFHSGFVTFKRYVAKLFDKIEFKIRNDYVLEEFDNIKIWFSKKFKSKVFNVEATIIITDGQITEVNATSSEIAQINPELIDSVKYNRTIALLKPPRIQPDNKSLYSLKEIFELIDPVSNRGNIFNQTEPDIVKSLTEKEFVRNRKQLEYLSVQKQSKQSKIYFTLNPLFGFVFLIEMTNKNYFIWELLKSHATYIWSKEKMDNNIGDMYKIIELYISEIKEIGREGYRKGYLNNNTPEGFTFKIIDHQDILSDPKNGFTRWSEKLDEILNSK
jgi:hypothetical protein